MSDPKSPPEMASRGQFPPVEIFIEKRYVIRVNGLILPQRFKEVNEMAGMKHLKSADGSNIVVDMPVNVSDMLASAFGEDIEPFEARVVKASPDFVKSAREAMEPSRPDNVQPDEEEPDDE